MENFHCKPDSETFKSNTHTWIYRNKKTGETVALDHINSIYWTLDWECIDSTTQEKRFSLKESELSCILTALESGLEHAKSTLAEHDSSLGRTTCTNRTWAETIEKDIQDIMDSIKVVKSHFNK